MYVSEDSDDNEEEPGLQSESQNNCVVCLTTLDATWIFIQWMPVISTSSGTALNVHITGMFL